MQTGSFTYRGKMWKIFITLLRFITYLVRKYSNILYSEKDINAMCNAFN